MKKKIIFFVQFQLIRKHFFHQIEIHQRLEGLVADNLVVVVEVTFFPLLLLVALLVLLLLVLLFPLLEIVVLVTLDNFLALEVVGFIKLKLALGVVLLAFTGLEGVKVTPEVILIGLDLIFGLEMPGFIKPFLLLLKSCWLKNEEKRGKISVNKQQLNVFEIYTTYSAKEIREIKYNCNK